MPYIPNCARIGCNNAAKWVRLKMRPNTPYYLCNTCYQSIYPAGQSNIFVPYPRIKE